MSQSERKRRAAREREMLAKQGVRMAPVVLQGRTIASTFWGKAWCENLERYSDYANRLPRGRTYVRNGSVVDLALTPGAVEAQVMGSSLYRVKIEIAPLAKARWKALCESCTGAIDSVVELLQGRIARGVMEQLCAKETGLFPAPRELKLACSCPDWATMCKHVAATLYGVGARLDQSPELFFVLRQVDQQELLANAGTALSAAGPELAEGRRLADDALDALFGIDLGGGEAEVAARAPTKTRSDARKTPRKPAKRTQVAAKQPTRLSQTNPKAAASSKTAPATRRRKAAPASSPSSMPTPEPGPRARPASKSRRDAPRVRRSS
ncbi:MAG: hypothetical protein HZA53_16145 [Planctomycetes bacterium]|nr:hypothetical protein [Planctomycetota bacterium]